MYSTKTGRIAVPLCEKSIPPEKRTIAAISWPSAKSGGGEQFLPLDCAAEARMGVVVCSCLQAPAITRHAVTTHARMRYFLSHVKAFVLSINIPIYIHIYRERDIDR